MHGVSVDTEPGEAEATVEARRLLEAVALTCKAGDVSRRLEFGPPVDVLMRLVVEERADLLVVGTRRRGAMRAALRGSIAHKMLEISPCPVLVVAV